MQHSGTIGGVFGVLLATLAMASPAADSAAQTAPMAAAPEPSHGQLLYENHCTGCHTSLAHRRDNHKAKSAADVNGWVRRWATELNLGWTQDDIEDVTRYLVKHYYRFESRTGNASDITPQTAQIAPSIGCPE